MVNIGKSVIIKGELTGSEDLTIEGQVEGKIELRQNVLTIGPNGKIKAQVFAKAVVVQGEVHGQHHRDRARRHPRQRDRSTAICRRRAWRLPMARTSAAASTCRRAARRPSRVEHRPSEQKPATPTTLGHDGGLATGHRGDAGSVAERRPRSDRGPARVGSLQLGRTET